MEQFFTEIASLLNNLFTAIGNINNSKTITNTKDNKLPLLFYILSIGGILLFLIKTFLPETPNTPPVTQQQTNQKREILNRSSEKIEPSSNSVIMDIDSTFYCGIDEVDDTDEQNEFSQQQISKSNISIKSKIDTTLQVFSHEPKSSNTKTAHIPSFNITEDRPKNNKGLLILRAYDNKHSIRYSIDYGNITGSLYRPYNPSDRNPAQALHNLSSGIHKLDFIDCSDTLYSGYIQIDTGKTHLKNFVREYPYGENTGRLVIYPNQQKTPCRITLSDRDRIIRQADISEKPVTIDLPDGSYLYSIYSINNSPLNKTDTEWITIHAGHRKERKIKD